MDPIVPGSEPTTRELFIMFANVNDILHEIKDNMATREFVDSKFDTFNSRIGRVEEDIKRSTIDQEKLEAEIQTKLDVLEAKLAARIEELDRQHDSEAKENQSLKSSRSHDVWMIVLSSGIGIVGGAVLSLVFHFSTLLS